MTTRSPTPIADRAEAASCEPDAPVAVLGRRSEAQPVVGLIEEGGGAAAALAGLEQLASYEGQVAAAIFVGASLVDVAGRLKSVGGAQACPRAIVVCEAIRPGETRIALASGVCGVLLEEELESSLLPCLAAVLADQVCVPRRQSRQVDAAALSTREKQILGLVVMGCMNSEIAEQLVVAESTVKSHLSSAFAKLGVRSRHEAVDLILDSERGLGMGILSLGGEPIGEPGMDSR